jgi:MarR family transcriptional regulator, organic hydroperoxide resistance regulator
MPARPPRLFHLMSLAQHRLLKTTDTAFDKAVGISMTQLGVLFILEQSPGALLKDVSEALGINKSATTALVDRMETAGLVRRQASEDDGRAVCLYATRSGLSKAIAARPILSGLNAQLTDGFNERELATVERFLRAILERF